MCICYVNSARAIVKRCSVSMRLFREREREGREEREGEREENSNGKKKEKPRDEPDAGQRGAKPGRKNALAPTVDRVRCRAS